MAASKSSSGLTLTILGCGTMGIAISSGIMRALEELKNSSSPPADTPPRLPNRIIACVRREESGKKIQSVLGSYDTALEISINENVRAVEAADVILLGCKPYMAQSILSESGMRNALRGKLLISILAGTPVEGVETAICGGSYGTYPTDLPHVVRVMPNTAGFVRESMTVIAASNPPLPEEWNKLVEWMFGRIGPVVTLLPHLMDAATSLCGSGPAFAALFMEGLADGGVAMGIPRAEAQIMAAQVLKGTAGLVAAGEHPAVLREKVSTPGGCTIGGLLVLEEGAVRGTVAKAVREATVVASKLGVEGTKNVNAPR
ncbi:pyrroline-5-carboxylate reductase [Trichodelitschia bisporula]|uniref:Pyrroline-5-carboxylate reductase n=1 Tax=Trichodelitschia bisporula TaxID=703511 RepID=A0A6G1I9U9_9PEZI|nr:pyrroline-5-carboxylate reductase [Trichodelitschia bisporula]